MNCVWAIKSQVEEENDLMRMKADADNDFSKTLRVHLEVYMNNSTNSIIIWLGNIYGTLEYDWALFVGVKSTYG